MARSVDTGDPAGKEEVDGRIETTEARLLWTGPASRGAMRRHSTMVK